MADVNDGRVFEDKSLGTTVSFTLQNSLSLFREGDRKNDEGSSKKFDAHPPLENKSDVTRRSNSAS